MRTPDQGINMPTNNIEEPTTSEKSLQEAEKLFDQALSEFRESAPDFSPLLKCLDDIKKELKAFDEDFGIILHEPTEYGGGYAANSERIENMKQAVPELKAKIAEAEKIIDSDEIVFGPFRNQIDAAKKIVTVLERI